MIQKLLFSNLTRKRMIARAEEDRSIVHRVNDLLHLFFWIKAKKAVP